MQGAAQRLIWCSMQGRVRASKILSEQLRSRKVRLQRIQRAVDRMGRGEGAVIAAFDFACSPVFCDLRRRVILAYQNIGKALIVAQQNIIAGLEFFDQTGFQQQGLGLALRNHKFHGMGGPDHPLDAHGMALIAGIGIDPFF